MPPSTRARPSAPSSVELSSGRRDLRLRLRNMSADALRRAENSEDNCCYGLVYTPVILRLLLLAYTDDYGFIRPTDKADIRLLFRERTAWKLGTHFRSVWCAITVCQVGQKMRDGWTCDQIDQDNQNTDLANINLFALLFQVCMCLICLIAWMLRAVFWLYLYCVCCELGVFRF